MVYINLHEPEKWRVEQKILNTIEFSEKNKAKINNVRDFNRYLPRSERARYFDQTYNLDKLESAYFIVVPFGILGLFAHLMVQFNFTDSKPVVLSIEARRRPGMPFSPLHGMVGRYGLIYTWGSICDLIGLRKDHRKNKIYTYEFDYSKDELKQMMTYFLNETQNIHDNPKYYNSLWANCMTKLRAGFPRRKRKKMHRAIGSFFYSFVARDLIHYGFLKNYVPLDIFCHEHRHLDK